jgi:PBSX family phage terminase large subunit
MRQAFSDKQRQVFREAYSRWNILSGAVRSGKTFGSFFMLPIRVLEQGPGNFLLVGKTERTLKRNVIDPLRGLYGPQAVSQIYGDGLCDLFGRRCYVVGANDERAVTKIQGIGLVYAYGDEVTTWPESFFEMLKSRLDRPGAKFDGTCNPGSPYHWLKQFIDTTEDKWLKHFHFQLDDNPFLDSDFVEALKAEYSGVWYQRYILGMWVQAEGAVFDIFDEAKHVIKPSDIPVCDEYIVAGDYGTHNPTAFMWIGKKGDKVYVIDEYYWDSVKHGRQKTDSEQADDLMMFVLQASEAEGSRPSAIVLDPSAASFITECRKRNIHIVEANNAVLDGIRLMASLMGSDRFYVSSKCENLRKELASYVWDEKAQQRGEDKPKKEFDHAVDACRYGVMHMMKNGPRVRRL